MKSLSRRIEEKGTLARVIGKNCLRFLRDNIKKRRAFEDESEKKRAFSGILRSVVSLSSFS